MFEGGLVSVHIRDVPCKRKNNDDGKKKDGEGWKERRSVFSFSFEGVGEQPLVNAENVVGVVERSGTVVAGA